MFFKIKLNKIKKNIKICKLRKIVLYVFLMLLPLDILAFYNFNYSNKIFPNIYVNNFLIGGKAKKEAYNFLENNLNKNNSLNLISSTSTYKINEKDLELQYKTKETIEKAFFIGRNDNFFKNIVKRINLLTEEERIDLEIIYDEVRLENFLASVSAELNQPNVPPTISIENTYGQKTVVVNKGSPGRMVDVQMNREKIIECFKNQSFGDTSLAVKTLAKKVSEEEKEEIKNLSQNLLGKSLILKYDDLSWEIGAEEMISFLSFYSVFDETRLKSWIAEASKIINREPKNALLTFEGSIVTQFQPALEGLKVDEEDSLEIIKNGIRKLSENGENRLEVALAVVKTEPEITTDKVNNLGIKKLIGKGESWFPHSIEGRIHNVDLASSKFHGILIDPGETFSFNQAVGEIDSAHGYQPAYIIKEGRTILGDGGGVCQVSTTMFRAALDAGLNITERRAHAYRVSYYEVNSELGTDATVYSPSPDLKFVNDTPAHILIQRVIDLNNLYLSFEFYGTDDGRKVTMSKSRIWDQVPPPPDVYQDDPTLQTGVVKQVDWSAWGAKAAFDWKVERDGEILREKTWFSIYKPWAAVFLRGTK